MSNPIPQKANWPLGFIGAIVGVGLGFLAVLLLLKVGLHGAMLPGALLGIGFATGFQSKSEVAGIGCGILGLAAGVFTEWHFFPFIADDSLSFFLQNFFDVHIGSQIMIYVGAVFAYWFGRGR